jgi:Ca2+-binding EF-hand superfamily protein
MIEIIMAKSSTEKFMEEVFDRFDQDDKGFLMTSDLKFVLFGKMEERCTDEQVCLKESIAASLGSRCLS